MFIDRFLRYEKNLMLRRCAVLFALLPLVFLHAVAALCGSTLAPALATQKNPLESPELFWSEARPLSWQDFWGEPPPASLLGGEAARIWLELKYSASWEISFDAVHRQWIAQLSHISAQAIMDRQRSWALPDRRSPDLLRHEQGHFDLLEIFRRRLERELFSLLGRKATASTREGAEQRLTAVLEEVYKRVWQAHEACQTQYDQETRNGQDRLKQEQWNNLIAQWLRDSARALPRSSCARGEVRP